MKWVDSTVRRRNAKEALESDARRAQVAHRHIPGHKCRQRPSAVHDDKKRFNAVARNRSQKGEDGALRAATGK